MQSQTRVISLLTTETNADAPTGFFSEQSYYWLRKRLFPRCIIPWLNLASFLHLKEVMFHGIQLFPYATSFSSFICVPLLEDKKLTEERGRKQSPKA